MVSHPAPMSPPFPPSSPNLLQKNVPRHICSLSPNPSSAFEPPRAIPRRPACCHSPCPLHSSVRSRCGWAVDKGRKQCEASGQTSLDGPLSRAGGHDSTVPPEAGREATSGLRRNLAVPKLGKHSLEHEKHPIGARSIQFDKPHSGLGLGH